MSADKLRISLGKSASVSQDPAPLQAIVPPRNEEGKKQNKEQPEDSTVPASWRTSFSF